MIELTTDFVKGVVNDTLAERLAVSNTQRYLECKLNVNRTH